MILESVCYYCHGGATTDCRKLHAAGNCALLFFLPCKRVKQCHRNKISATKTTGTWRRPHKRRDSMQLDTAVTYCAVAKAECAPFLLAKQAADAFEYLLFGSASVEFRWLRRHYLRPTAIKMSSTTERKGTRLRIDLLLTISWQPVPCHRIFYRFISALMV